MRSDMRFSQIKSNEIKLHLILGGERTNVGYPGSKE